VSLVPEMAVETVNLTKKFGQQSAVASLNLQVPRGSIYGFLGPNGAGKTTTIKMLLNLVYPTAGEGKIFGLDIVSQSTRIRERVGYVSETQSMYGYMTVKEIIRFCRGLYPKWNEAVVKKYLEIFELSAGKKVRHLSKGMKTQLGLTLALGPEPDLLLLDEPTSGLDPIKTKEFLGVILAQVADTGQTVFFSSHQLHEVERIADLVGLIAGGRLKLDISMDEIKLQRKKITVVFTNEEFPPGLQGMPGILKTEKQGRGYVITIENNAEEVLQKLQSYQPADLHVYDRTLEEIFEEYAGRDACD
jgi:ABC-2 type transport system ATP-binding protein